MPPDPESAKHVILCLNSGSSSLKFALYHLGEGEEVRLAHGAVERIGLAGGQLWIRGMDSEALADVHRDFPGHTAAAEGVSVAAKDLGFPPPVAVGHRVVHGGPDHTAPERVEAPLLAELRRLVPFAPLHLPSAIQGIEAVAARFPGLPQVACFDTAFHRRMPEVAQRLPLARDLWHEGIRRYGFHGLSYEYVVAALGAAAQGRLVIAHLGNGASLAAVLNGQPLDTTMGFTPTGGLMMGTRSGDLDPGLLVHLMHEKGYDAGRLDELVNHQAKRWAPVRCPSYSIFNTCGMYWPVNNAATCFWALAGVRGPLRGLANRCCHCWRACRRLVSCCWSPRIWPRRSWELLKSTTVRLAPHRVRRPR